MNPTMPRIPPVTFRFQAIGPSVQGAGERKQVLKTIDPPHLICYLAAVNMKLNLLLASALLLNSAAVGF
jgi:hypothetical protein